MVWRRSQAVRAIISKSHKYEIKRSLGTLPEFKASPTLEETLRSSSAQNLEGINICCLMVRLCRKMPDLIAASNHVIARTVKASGFEAVRERTSFVERSRQVTPTAAVTLEIRDGAREARQ